MSCPSGNWHDLCINQGYPFTSSLTIRDSNGTPINISGYSFTGTIEPTYVGPTLNVFNITPTIPYTGGIINFGLTNIQTSGLPATQCVYSIWAIPTGSLAPIQLLQGYLNVYPF